MTDRVTVTFHMHRRRQCADLDLPLDITAHNLVLGLNQAFSLQIPVEDIANCYLAAENPIALLRGNRTLREIGLRDGSQIHFTR